MTIAYPAAVVFGAANRDWLGGQAFSKRHEYRRRSSLSASLWREPTTYRWSRRADRGTVRIVVREPSSAMSLSREPPATNRSAPSAARSGPSAADTATILVVDDEPYIVDLLTLALTDEGYQVECAYDGEQAWKLVHEQPPDLIITDISMPRLDGLDLLRRLRRQSLLADIPVILMSAARSTVDVRDVTFVPKPFDLDRMLSLVQSELAVA